MKLVKLISILAFILIPSSVLAQDKEHDDKEHAKAEKNLDHAHWKNESTELLIAWLCLKLVVF